jgi:hypothetical protein
LELNSIDPNQFAGWIVLAGVVVGTVWKFSSWLRKYLDSLVLDNQAAILDRLTHTDENQAVVVTQLTLMNSNLSKIEGYVVNHDARLAWLEGQSGQPLGSMKEGLHD